LDGFAHADAGTADGAGKGMRLSEAKAAFYERSVAGRRPSTRLQLKMVLGRLEECFGRLEIAKVTHRQLEPWVNGLAGNYTTRHNHLRIGRRFFQFCVDWLEVIPRNPFRKVHLVDERSGSADIPVLAPDQLQACLLYALHLTNAEHRRRLVAYLCLGGFAGLRTEEILCVRWEDINFAAREIYVRQPKRVRGWKPRYVEMLPAFRFHLAPLAPQQAPVESREDRRSMAGTFGHNTAMVLPGGQRTLYCLRKAMMVALGWDAWPNNCLRHSFATYYLAEFNDLAKLRGQLGQESEDVTRARYVMPAKKAARKRWWALRVNG